MAPKPLQQGDPAQIGRYRLTARLGAGGMGVVYLGQAGDGRGDGREVAVKVLRPEYADDGEFRARFRREVDAMARVRNRYTVQVLEADTESAMPFIATQFADGPSLDEQVKARGPLHPEATIRLAAALAEALAAIHAVGVTHRDLKPSNVLLTGAGPMVIDFGIAQIADTVSITRTGMAIGSPGYMAPEQVTGHAGREADIFTWALMVGYAASGQPPFGTGPTVTILHRILNDKPDVSAVPRQLMPLVQAALEKDPRRRPTAAQLLRELSPGATAAMPPGATAAMVPETAVDGEMARTVRNNGFGNTARTRAIYDEPSPRRRRWVGPAVAAAAIVVLAGAGAAVLATGGLSGGGSGSGNSPTPPATGPALSGTQTGAGSVTQTGAPTRAGTGQVPLGRVKKHRHDGTGLSDQNGDGDGSAGSGGEGGSAPTASPSVSPAASPSATVSVAPSASSASSAATASASPGSSAG